MKFKLVEDINNRYLYHATYAQFLNSIKKNGLGNTNNKMWTDSKYGVVYLANDPWVAESYAETSEWVDEQEDPDDYLDNIIILEIDVSKLDLSKLKADENVLIDDEDNVTWEYHGVIPFSDCKIFNDASLCESDEINSVKFKFVEDTLNEDHKSYVNELSKSSIVKMMQSSKDSKLNSFDFSKILKGSYRHHLVPGTLETIPDAKAGNLHPSLILPATDETEFTLNAIHFIVEHYKGKNLIDFIKYVYKIATMEVVYENSKEIKVAPLYKIMKIWNR